MGAWSRLIWLRIGTGGGVLLKAVSNLLIPQNAGNFVTEEISSQEEVFCVGLTWLHISHPYHVSITAYPFYLP